MHRNRVGTKIETLYFFRLCFVSFLYLYFCFGEYRCPRIIISYSYKGRRGHGRQTVGQILTWAAAFTLIATEVREIMIGDDAL